MVTKLLLNAKSLGFFVKLDLETMARRCTAGFKRWKIRKVDKREIHFFTKKTNFKETKELLWNNEVPKIYVLDCRK